MSFFAEYQRFIVGASLLIAVLFLIVTASKFNNSSNETNDTFKFIHEIISLMRERDQTLSKIDNNLAAALVSKNSESIKNERKVLKDFISAWDKKVADYISSSPKQLIPAFQEVFSACKDHSNKIFELFDEARKQLAGDSKGNRMKSIEFDAIALDEKIRLARKKLLCL